MRPMMAYELLQGLIESTEIEEIDVKAFLFGWLLRE